MDDSESDPGLGSETSETEVTKNGNEREIKEKEKSKVVTVTIPTPRILTEKNENINSNSNETEKTGINVKSAPSEKVKVIVRCRPLSRKEMDNGHTAVVNICRKKNEIEIRRPNPSSANLVHAKSNKIFTFDTVYDNEISQKELYEDAFRSLVDSVLEGFNGTIFAYGQTGTGKTYTMEGIRDKEEHHGVIPHAFKHIFQKISDSPSKKYLVRASYLEIYQEDIRDLLFKDRVKTCELKESGAGVYVKDLSSYLCANFNQINELMTRGNKNRSVGATNMNEHSSRSHAIFMITVEASEKWADGRTHFRVGRLNLVDLAGSERQGKSGAEGERLKEAVKINLSLSALGNVIASLADGRSSHIPYRDSKLTRLLQDSLGGNSRTIMVATIGPASFNYDETMTTLRYASRAKRIKNKPKVNEDPKDAMLREYQEEIAKLRAELAARKEQNPSLFHELPSPSSDSSRPRSRKSRPTTAVPIEGLKLLDDKHFKDLLPMLEHYGLDHTRDPKEIMELLEDRKRELLRDNETVKGEKERLLRKIEETQDRVKGAKEECFKLYDRIDWLESKVLNGGKSLLDHTNEQQKLIEQRKKELEEQRLREEDIIRKIAEQELSTNEVREIIGNLEGEVAYKRNKLNRLSGKLEKVRDRFGQAQFEYSDKRTELELCQLDIHKELKLKNLITDNFIPLKSRDTIESLTRFNEEKDSYFSLELSSMHISRPPVNQMVFKPLYNDGTALPATDMYYTDSNILQLRPELPTQLTLEKPEMAFDPQITSLLNRAFSEVEKEVMIDCAKFNQQRIRRGTAKARLGEVINLELNQYVRPILSARQPVGATPGIKYRDFVAVARVPTRGKSAKLQRSLQSASVNQSDELHYSDHECFFITANSNPVLLPAIVTPSRVSDPTNSPDYSSRISENFSSSQRNPPGSARFIRNPPSDPYISPISARSTSHITSSNYATVTVTSSPRSTFTSMRSQIRDQIRTTEFQNNQLNHLQKNPTGGFSVSHPLTSRSKKVSNSMGDLNLRPEFDRQRSEIKYEKYLPPPNPDPAPPRPRSSRMVASDLLNINQSSFVQPPKAGNLEIKTKSGVDNISRRLEPMPLDQFDFNENRKLIHSSEMSEVSRPITAPFLEVVGDRKKNLVHAYSELEHLTKETSMPGLSQLNFLAGLFNAHSD